MKCIKCGVETGASWKRYCLPHWKQYVLPTKKAYRHRASSGNKAPAYSSPPTSAPRQPYKRPPKPNRLGAILGAIAGWAVLLGIFGVPIGLSVYDDYQKDNTDATSSVPTGSSFYSGVSGSGSPSSGMGFPVATAQPTFQTLAPVQLSPTVAPKPNASSYTVRSGDSWWSVATDHGVTVDALLIANGRNYPTDPLYPGDILIIPGSTFNPVFIPYQGNGGGPTLCRDGTYSHSSGRGTCSHHGGIAR